MVLPEVFPKTLDMLLSIGGLLPKVAGPPNAGVGFAPNAGVPNPVPKTEPKTGLAAKAAWPNAGCEGWAGLKPIGELAVDPPPNIDGDPAAGSPADGEPAAAAPPKNDIVLVLDAPPKTTSGLEGVFAKIEPTGEALVVVPKIGLVLLPENIEPPVVFTEALPNRDVFGIEGGLMIGFPKTSLPEGEEAVGVLGNWAFVGRPGVVVLSKVEAAVVVVGVILKLPKLSVVVGVLVAPVKLGIDRAGVASPNTEFDKEL